MTRFDDALRGYAAKVLERDDWVCRYCGLDGKQWPNWLYLSEDHLLPPGHPRRNEGRFRVACCRFCNEASNRTQWDVEGKTPEELVAQKRPTVLARREEYRRWWEEHVKKEQHG
jgi:hypothetical protein